MVSESERLRLLADYGVMDTGPDEVLDKLVALASTICDAPITLVSLVDATRQWFKARVGVTAQETPRELAFCAHAIATGTSEVFTVPDARSDPRFEANPLVTGDPRIVFYAGAPLVAEGGAKLGTLCVIDTKPRSLTETQERSLVMLAELAVKRLQECRDHAEAVATRNRYEAAFVSIGEAVVGANLRGEVTFLNPAATELTGWSNADANGRATGEVFQIVDEATGVSPDPVGNVVAAGARQTIDRTRLVRRDGSSVPIEVTLAPIRNARSEVTGVILVARDQTEARRKESELLALTQGLEVARNRLSAMFENAPAFVCTLRGPTHIYEMANRPYRKLVGTDRDLVGRRLAEALPEVVPQGFIALLDRVFASGQTHVSTEAVAMIDRHENGVLEKAFVNIIYQPWWDHGAVAGIDIFGFDVTDQVVARNQIASQQAQQQQSAALIAQLLDTMSDGFLALDSAWTLTTANQAFERISTLERDHALGRNFWDVFPLVRDERGATWTNYHRCMDERVPVVFESYYASLDRWTHQRANPTEDGGIAVFFHDITQAKRAELVLEKQAAFERLLIGIVSHDLRSPLGVVTMAAEMLDDNPELGQESRTLVARSRNAANRAVAMIEDLLDFTQARIGGGIRIERKDEDVVRVTQNVLSELEAAHPGRSVALRTEGATRANVDAGRFAQVIQNLVSNALKYSPASSEVTVVLASTASHVSLTVHNRGIPIPAATLPILFEPFERGTAQIDSVTRSVGLGLYIVKQIVEAHGGRIAATSSEEAGTTFRVTIPRS